MSSHALPKQEEFKTDLDWNLEGATLERAPEPTTDVAPTVLGPQTPSSDEQAYVAQSSTASQMPPSDTATHAQTSKTPPKKTVRIDCFPSSVGNFRCERLAEPRRSSTAP